MPTMIAITPNPDPPMVAVSAPPLLLSLIHIYPEVVLISQSNHPNRLGEQRALAHQMMKEGLKNPVVSVSYTHLDVYKRQALA